LRFRPKLRLILKEQHAAEESFIRFGPVQRIRKDRTEYVGFYPWRTNRDGRLILKTASPHRNEIVNFINRHLKLAPKSELLANTGEARKIFIVYWIIFVSFAISQSTLHDIIKKIGLELSDMELRNLSDIELRNLMYCLQLLKWIKVIPYSGEVYFYTAFDQDPFAYSFKSGVTDNDSARRKADIAIAIRKSASLPQYVRKLAAISIGLE
jgi:hypothetical protein